MNFVSNTLQLWRSRGLTSLCQNARLFLMKQSASATFHQRTFTLLFKSPGLTSASSQLQTSLEIAKGKSSILQLPAIQLLPWNQQQIRTRKRGTEYQPKNIKRKRTHGWMKRLSTRGGIEVILRRMLKGRKSLSH
ncbi:39S ribosomal protein L34, mitochondrial [Latimeria chalumnae]|uniref:Large ribosomal subunit protein bL34m n=1 Tax=Latimeria chalumnae TaxID=7897 RepID=H3AKC1_LATCH|nr:PREDICTED: 39S ribosomal protein L34, mitochondrial [Latimeria chalumnae]|eukprot:XP_006001681.1 PREDICTED: 39S ribosomal protein L34, mitochondrial [Latimeria chalumnae]